MGVPNATGIFHYRPDKSVVTSCLDVAGALAQVAMEEAKESVNVFIL